MHATDAITDAKHAIEICNACRYCEGYCAVFPAMTLQRSFVDADMAYLANLCHNCNGCFHACQFAPPHEYGINLPRNFADIRIETYEAYAWPQPLARAFRASAVVTAVVAALAIAAVLALFSTHLFEPQTGAGAFYRVISWAAMSAVAGGVLLFSILALVKGAMAFWADTRSPLSGPITLAAVWQATKEVATMRYLGGGGDGCNDADASFSSARRHAHHAVMYGFLLCLAATSVATVFDHALGWVAPYSYTSLPVVLGTLGGVGMILGCVGLMRIKLRTDPAPVSVKSLGADWALLVLLLLAALSGLALLALRETNVMGLLLALHLGVILALFLLLPYGKFVHGIYRATALLKAAVERQRHHPIG